MNLFPIWVCLPPGNAFPYSLTWGLKFYKLTVPLTRSFKHLMFMRIQGHLWNEFEHMDELNLKTHAHTERGRERLGYASCRAYTVTVNLCIWPCCLYCLQQNSWLKNSTLIQLLTKGWGQKERKRKERKPFP